MKYIFISIITALADLGVKEKVKKEMRVGEKRHIKGRLYLWHIKNRGLAYNKFEDERNKVVLASGAGVTAVFAALVYLIRSGAKPSAKIGPALILGGGLGNFIERVVHGEVTDFIYIDAPKAPIFNVADVVALFGGLITIVKSLV